MNPAFEMSNQGLTIEGITVADMHAAAGSPSFYIYHADTIRAQYQKLRDALPEQVEILYAVKPNPNRAVVRVLQSQGAGFEAASIGDLLIAESLGFDPNQIAFAGPAKSDEALRKALEMNIGGLHVESLGELERVDNIAAELGMVMKVGLRINTDFQFHGTDINMSGEPSKFGIDEDQMDTVIAASTHMHNVKLAGIHVYSATGILDAQQYMENVRYTFNVAARANQHFKVEWINYGGGYGIDYSGNSEFDLSTLKQQMDSAIAEHAFIASSGVRLITEPGRFLVADSGIYVARVIDRKISRGKSFLNLGGGVHQFIREAWVGVSHPIVNLSRSSDQVAEFDIGGELCTPTDMFARNYALPAKTEVGDYIGIMKAGAYGMTMSPFEFLSNPSPAELLIDKGQVHVVRTSKRVEESFADQPIPEGL